MGCGCCPCPPRCLMLLSAPAQVCPLVNAVLSRLDVTLVHSIVSKYPPWVGKIPWRRKWLPTLVFFSGKSHGPRSLVGYGPGGHKRVGHDQLPCPLSPLQKQGFSPGSSVPVHMGQLGPSSLSSPHFGVLFYLELSGSS